MCSFMPRIHQMYPLRDCYLGTGQEGEWIIASESAVLDGQKDKPCSPLSFLWKPLNFAKLSSRVMKSTQNQQSSPAFLLFCCSKILSENQRALLSWRDVSRVQIIQGPLKTRRVLPTSCIQPTCAQKPDCQSCGGPTAALLTCSVPVGGEPTS